MKTPRRELRVGWKKRLVLKTQQPVWPLENRHSSLLNFLSSLTTSCFFCILKGVHVLLYQVQGYIELRLLPELLIHASKYSTRYIQLDDVLSILQIHHALKWSYHLPLETALSSPVCEWHYYLPSHPSQKPGIILDALISPRLIVFLLSNVFSI